VRASDARCESDYFWRHLRTLVRSSVEVPDAAEAAIDVLAPARRTGTRAARRARDRKDLRPWSSRPPQPEGYIYCDQRPDQAIPKLGLDSVRHAASKSHSCHSPPAMFPKQVSRLVDSPDPPSWPRRRSRSSQLEQRPGHGSDPRFLCPTAFSQVNEAKEPPLGGPFRRGDGI
jgi:hypothetical protein